MKFVTSLIAIVHNETDPMNTWECGKQMGEKVIIQNRSFPLKIQNEDRSKFTILV